MLTKVTQVIEGTSTADNPNIEAVGSGPLWKQYNMIFAFWAQFCYVGSQVTVAAFFINYATEAASYTAAEGSNMLSYGLITFTVGRFVATGLATILQTDFIMVVYSICAIALTAYVSAGQGISGVAVLIIIFFFMAPMYPSLFSLGTANLGQHTKRGSGILVMGVCGGAVFPPIQGAIADSSAGTRTSYVVPMVGFVVVFVYVLSHWLRTGRHILRVKETLALTPEAAAEAGHEKVQVEALENRSSSDEKKN